MFPELFIVVGLHVLLKVADVPELGVADGADMVMPLGLVRTWHGCNKASCEINSCNLNYRHPESGFIPKTDYSGEWKTNY